METAEASADPEHWLDAHGDALFAYAVTRVRNQALAEDLVQDTLLAGITGLAEYGGKSSERTWLTGILKNKIVDHVRKSSREESYEADLEDGNEWTGKFDAAGHWVSAPAHWGDPALVAQNAQLKEAMMTCVQRLPEKLRMAFVLREIDGHETEALLQILNISTANNLWVMLSRGRERVRSCLDVLWNGAT